MSSLLLCVCLVSLALFTNVNALQMKASHFYDLVDMLILLGVIPDSPRTQTDFQRYVDLNVTRPPECPVSNDVYACDDNAQITFLNATASIGGARSRINRLDVASDLVVIRNFVGVVAFVGLPYRLHFIDSVWLTSSAIGDEFAHRLSQTTEFIFRNVSLPYYDFNVLIGPTRPLSFSRCQFYNVSVNCPVPQWLWPCFNATNVSPPCVNRTTLPPISSFGRELDKCASTYFCDSICTPPQPALCDLYYKNYLPSTPGFSTVEIRLFFLAEAISIDFQSNTDGLLVRIEIWDWFLLDWIVIDFGATDRTEKQSNLPLPPVLTNRFRVTFEQWFDTDFVTGLLFYRAMIGTTAPPIIPKVPLCPPGESFSERSVLDETLADSLCIGRLCQLSCKNAVNFTFDRAVVPQLLVIEGGNRWIGAELVSTPSQRTRVYRYNMSTTPINTVTLAPEVGVISRIRLIGMPESGGLPSPKLPSRIGLPGIFVKRVVAALPTGFLRVANASSCAAVPLPLGAIAVSSVQASSVYTYTSNGDLLRCAADGASWINETSSAKLAQLTLNRGAPTPLRKLVAVDRQLLAVVSASNILHDGSVTRALVNRRIVQTSIDVLDVATGVWFNNLLQHDVRRNISDIDLVANQNGSSFAVVERDSGEATVFDWRPFAFKLIACSENTDCHSCLTNMANVELCRWCGTRCASQQVNCIGNETSTRNVTLCPLVTTTTTTTTPTTAITNTTTTSIATSTETNTSLTNTAVQTVGPVNQTADPLIPLYAVLGAVGVLALIVAIGVAVWRFRTHPAQEEAKPIPLADVPAKPAGHYEDGQILSSGVGAYEEGNFNS
jgi:hypothetical protein